MSSVFTPSQAVDISKEKDWPMHLGMLDWDNTKIVFTKRSLVEFLKYTGVTIDPGFTSIQKLPRYAQFGILTASTDSEAEATQGMVTPADGSVRPLLEEEFPDDALATAPPRLSTDHSGNATKMGVTPAPPVEAANRPLQSTFVPSRRVRTIPGGTDSIGSMFSEDNPERFIPTRRVRQRPGGEDNIEGLF